jgi:hypothetical protein
VAGAVEPGIGTHAVSAESYSTLAQEEGHIQAAGIEQANAVGAIVHHVQQGAIAVSSDCSGSLKGGCSANAIDRAICASASQCAGGPHGLWGCHGSAGARALANDAHVKVSHVKVARAVHAAVLGVEEARCRAHAIGHGNGGAQGT